MVIHYGCSNGNQGGNNLVTDTADACSLILPILGDTLHNESFQSDKSLNMGDTPTTCSFPGDTDHDLYAILSFPLTITYHSKN